MIDEENQLENTQNSAVESSENAQGAASASEEIGITEEGLSDAQAPVVEEETSDGGGTELGAAEVSESPADNFDYNAAIAELTNEIKNLKLQLEERTNQCVRIAADFDNYRKRTQREREELEQQIKCSTINELLPVVDNFERARSQIKPQTEQETNIHKSYQSVYKQLVECLKRIGVAPMRSEGKEFDPNLHEAVMRQPTTEHPEGTVLEELQRGYMLGDRVLRHALVKVAAAPEPGVDSEENNQGGSES
ncbi:MAG: nucleotide exchange factor GrpE [Leptolyngbyaceae cyanobacterium HOT.MB2.61]|nr:nucleotide exchange factor GrpE [Leptolyngbyaceae cyanobacterium HOT.MB2.61]